MKRLSLIMAAALVILQAALFAACGDDEESNQPGATEKATDGEGEPVKVGAVMSVAGPFAGFAEAQLNVLRMAIDQINSEGGIQGRQVELVFYDDEGDQAKSMQLTNRLINNDKVDVIFGPNITPTGEVVAPIIEDAGVIEIGFLAQKYLWEGTKHIFMTWPAQTTNAQAMVEYAKECAGATKVAILFADVPYGLEGEKFLKEHIEELQLDLVFSDKFQEGGFEFTPQARNAVNADPDVVFLWGSSTPADGNMFKQLREAGFDGPIVMDLVGGSPQIVEIATPQLTEGLVTFTLADFANPDADAQAFIDQYTEKFGSAPPPYTTITFDAPFIYKAAAEKAGSTDPSAVADAMIGLNIDRLTGTYEITEDDHVGLAVGAFDALIYEGQEFKSSDCEIGA